MARAIAAWFVDLLLLAGGLPLAVGLARLAAGSSWPQVALALFLAGAALYGVGLRLSPLKATLGQELLGARRTPPAPPPGPGARPESSSPRRFCRACGHPTAPDARFCRGCGKALA